MSLYGTSVTIGGVPCGLVVRGASNGQYQAVFEREFATLEQIEAIDWSAPAVTGDCILPAGYGFEVADIQYSAATRSYTVVLQVSGQYLGDVAGYQAQVSQLQSTIQEQSSAMAEKDSTIAGQEETIQAQQNTIDSQAADLEELRTSGTAEALKADLQAAYTEGVESNG